MVRSLLITAAIAYLCVRYNRGRVKHSPESSSSRPRADCQPVSRSALYRRVTSTARFRPHQRPLPYRSNRGIPVSWRSSPRREAERTDVGLTAAIVVCAASGDVLKLNSYLKSHGLKQEGSGLLTRSYAGTVEDTEAAFHTQLGTYRSSGVTFRSPTTTPQLPVSIASAVQNVSGLDTYPVSQPAVSPATNATVPSRPLAGTASPATTSACFDAGWAQAINGYGDLPGELAAPSEYNSNRSWTVARTAAATRSRSSSLQILPVQRGRLPELLWNIRSGH